MESRSREALMIQQFQAEQSNRVTHDDMSALTGFLSAHGFNANAGSPSRPSERYKHATPPTSSSSSTSNQHLLEIARRQPADHYKNLNDGRGLKYNKYCWKCGCNCTHWSRRCYELSTDERERYSKADFDNMMGGSTRYMDRRGH